MDKEKKIQILQIAKMVLIIVCASLYAWGGMEMSWLRRFVAPTICGVGCLIISKDWRVLIKVPLLASAACLGYGADQMLLKIFKRGYVGLAFGLGATSSEIWKAIQDDSKLWVWVGFAIFTIVLSYILLGAFNPLKARIEESCLGVIVYIFAIMPVQRKGYYV